MKHEIYKAYFGTVAVKNMISRLWCVSDCRRGEEMAHAEKFSRPSTSSGKH